MFSFTIVESEVRTFMNKLLREEVFDFFEVRAAEIVSFARFEINGANALTEDKEFCRWQELRPHVYSVIKGKRPKTLKIVFSLPPEKAVHENASCFLNLLFDGKEVLCTASATEKAFAIERSTEDAWREFVVGFYRENHITIRRN